MKQINELELRLVRGGVYLNEEKVNKAELAKDAGKKAEKGVKKEFERKKEFGEKEELM